LYVAKSKQNQTVNYNRKKTRKVVFDGVSATAQIDCEGRYSS